MNISPEFMWQLFIGICTGGGAYAAIRYDLGRLHERATQALASAEQAHRRIDSLSSLKR